VGRVRVQPIGDTWEELGVDRWEGRRPTGLVLAADVGGPTTASFALARPVDEAHPDLLPDTPVVIGAGPLEVAWRGRIKDTPSVGGGAGGEESINVQAEGLQAHLDDDDLLRALYVHDDLTAWRPHRSFAGADLTQHVAVGQVNVGDGAIAFAIPQGATIVSGKRLASATLDLGPDPARWAERVIIELEPVTTSVSWRLYVSAHTTENEAADDVTGATARDMVNLVLSAAGVQFLRLTPATPRRYITTFYYWSGATATASVDHGVKIRAARVFGEAAYESGDASVVKADAIIKDTLDAACPLLSPVRGLVEATDWNIRDFHIPEPVTPRQIIERADSYHRRQFKIDLEDRPVYRPWPTAPLFEVKDGTTFDDATANSRADIVNRVIVVGRDPSGAELELERRTGALSGATLEAAAAPPTIPNPSFEVDATGWTVLIAGALTRTTTAGEFESGVAGGKHTMTNTNGGIKATFTGTFKKGVTYVLELVLKGPAAGSQANVQFGAPVAGGVPSDGVQTEGGSVAGYVLIGNTAFERVRLAWTPRTDRTDGAVSVLFDGAVGTQSWLVDSVGVYRSAATILDRRGTTRARRLEVRAPTNLAAMALLGDAFLERHRATPLRGSFTALAGDRETATVSRVLGGEPVHPVELIRHTGELVYFSSLIDPTTGQKGRLGVIVGVSYAEDTDSASVSVDNSRDNLEALFARMDVVTGGSR
jgi:hypothetical protein